MNAFNQLYLKIKIVKVGMGAVKAMAIFISNKFLIERQFLERGFLFINCKGG